MSESTRALLKGVRKVPLRCWLLGFVVLLLWFAATVLQRDAILQGQAIWFGLTKHELDLIMYCGTGLWKLMLIALFFIPWLSIRMVRKSA